MADTAVETTTTTEISAKELKEKKEVAEEVMVEKKENGSGDAPGNETHTNGAEEKTNGAIHSEVTPEVEEDGEGDDAAEDAEEAADEEVDHPVKRPAEEEEQVETKKQKTENNDSKDAEVEA
ncbi:parathymosin [Salvelinus sp. IW2-2015]|uniref:parathymosin n=1 Tax=Salvelinus sp. IW2-2015 TaxID=2691554 RepID=UPI000CDFA770|nr:parathymosin [Salvelinus alpinus]